MQISQSEIEDLLREKARRRAPSLKRALAKIEHRLANWKELWPHWGYKVPRWEKMAKMYREDLALIADNSYRGYNGKPFGATPGITKGLV